MILTAEAQRVLGALMEKEMVTPDLYPLSMNSLIAASNQRSSRDPVTNLSEEQVRTALDTLEALECVTVSRDGGRVTKYEHRVRTVLNLRRDETAVLCLLLLRGPQTPGELRSRADRMFAFDDLAQVQGTLERMAGRDEPLVAVLARQPGSREARWAQLLGGSVDVSASSQATDAPGAAHRGLPTTPSEIASLEERLAALEERVRRLEAKEAEG